jgi:hypothetical protein
LQRVGGAKKSKNRKIRKMKISPYVLQARPVENFSGCLCQQVYEGDRKAKDEAQSIWRIRALFKDSAENFLKNFEGCHC